MLLSPHSRLRLGGGDTLGCRGQRLCGSGLLVSGGSTRATALDREDSLLSTVQGYMRSAHAGGTHSDTRSLSASSELWESFLDTPTHDGGEGTGLLEMRRGPEISRASRPVGPPSRQTCCRCHPRWRRLPCCREGS